MSIDENKEIKVIVGFKNKNMLILFYSNINC